MSRAKQTIMATRPRRPLGRRPRRALVGLALAALGAGAVSSYVHAQLETVQSAVPVPGRVATGVDVTQSLVIEPAEQAIPESLPIAGLDDNESATTLHQIIVLPVVAGPYSWQAIEAEAPSAGVRLFAGEVRYLHGDGEGWSVTARVIGAHQVTLTPSCQLADHLRDNARAFGSDDFTSAVAGEPVKATGDDVVTLCRTMRQPTGGVWSAHLDADGEVSSGVEVTIQLHRLGPLALAR